MTASANPLILTCGGASPDAAQAEAVADDLAAAGLGIRAKAPAADAPLIAVDGCAGACCSRRLDSAGLRPAAVVDTAAAGGSAGAIASTRVQLDQQLPRRHRARRRPPIPTPATQRAHTVRDYLVALDELTTPLVDCGVFAPGLPALSSHVSRLLGVSRASAGEMLERLARAGMVTRTHAREVLLTAAGQAASDAAIRRHRLLEVFAVSELRYDIADSFEAARAFDPAFDDDAMARLAAALGTPTLCPHGWPIDPREGYAAAPTLRTLETVEDSEPATVLALRERPVAALRELAAAGVEPGARVDADVRNQLSAAARNAAFVCVSQPAS